MGLCGSGVFFFLSMRFFLISSVFLILKTGYFATGLAPFLLDILNSFFRTIPFRFSISLHPLSENKHLRSDWISFNFFFLNAVSFRFGTIG